MIGQLLFVDPAVKRHPKLTHDLIYLVLFAALHVYDGILNLLSELLRMLPSKIHHGGTVLRNVHHHWMQDVELG